MRLRAYLASFASLALILPLIGLVAWPHFVLAGFFDRVLRLDPAWRRTRAARRNSRWAYGLFHLFAFVMRIRCDFRLPVIPQGVTRSWIILFNHQHTVEGLLVPHFLAKLGQMDLRFVAKRETAHYPAVGSAIRNSGSVFVARNGNLVDLQQIARCARTAQEDLASVLIFPEGTRWTPRRATGSTYQRVLPPKAGGFTTIRREMPDAPVLSGTLRWERFGTAGKTMFQLADLYGQTVTVTARLIPPEEVGVDPAAWLVQEWTDKDAFIASRA